MPVRSATFLDCYTLIYHPDPVSSPSQDFPGPIHVWRPGWSRGRQISSGRGFTCIGQEHSSAAACFDDPEGGPHRRGGAVIAEIRVGGASLDELGPVQIDDDAGAPVVFVGKEPLFLVFPRVGPSPDPTGIFAFGPVPL